MNDLDTRLRHMAREEETPVPKDFDENLTRTLAQLPARKRRRVPGRCCWQPAWCWC